MVKGVDPLRPALARVGWSALFTNDVGGAILHSFLCSLYGLPPKQSKVCKVVFEARGVARCLSFYQNSVPLTPRGREKLAALLSPLVLVVGCLVMPFGGYQYHSPEVGSPFWNAWLAPLMQVAL